MSKKIEEIGPQQMTLTACLDRIRVGIDLDGNHASPALPNLLHLFRNRIADDPDISFFFQRC